eukprot:79850-Hanusia_phi.AAC.1
MTRLHKRKAPDRFPDDPYLKKRCCPNDNPIQVTVAKLKSKLDEVRRVYAQAENNWKKSGSETQSIHQQNP